MLFCFCLRVVWKKRTPKILSMAAVASYSLSAVYVALDLRRVATSYTINPEMPLMSTYVSDRTHSLSHVVSYIFIAEVCSVHLDFFALLVRSKDAYKRQAAFPSDYQGYASPHKDLKSRYQMLMCIVLLMLIVLHAPMCSPWYPMLFWYVLSPLAIQYCTL